MTYPVVSETAQRLYDSLPAVYRSADAAAAGPGQSERPLLRFLSSWIDPGVGRLEVLLDRLLPDEAVKPPQYVIESTSAGEGTAGSGVAGGRLVLVPSEPQRLSALGDPDQADPEWLPWLAQFVGARVGPTATVEARRAAIRAGSAGWRAGSRPAVAAAAATALTGSQYVRVQTGRTDTGAGGPLDVLLITRTSETPDPAAVLAAVVAAEAKPAGVKLWLLAYTATWAQIQTAYPTWATRNELTWGQLAETGAGTS